jgi:hypothetical protein
MFEVTDGARALVDDEAADEHEQQEPGHESVA